jgi:hypothetical protein
VRFPPKLLNVRSDVNLEMGFGKNIIIFSFFFFCLKESKNTHNNHKLIERKYIKFTARLGGGNWSKGMEDKEYFKNMSFIPLLESLNKRE